MNVSVFDRVVEDYKNIKAKTYIGIFGNPIKHTLSPVIHNTISEMLGIEETYIPFHIDVNLDEYAKSAFDEGILGLNITVPYKQDIMASLVDIDDAAKAIGAVNTLVRVEGGYKGYNTDMPGLARAIESENVSLKDKNVIILGAGGAARAVVYMCMLYGAQNIYIINRTLENAKKLALDMTEAFKGNDNVYGKIFALAADDYKSIPADEYIFIQSTSVGLKADDGLPLVQDESFYDMASFGIDLIYNPAKTRFIKVLEEKNIKCANGLKMLLYQGIMAYELWNKVNVSEEICDIVYRRLKFAIYGDSDNVSEKSNIILVGYMGAGKTTVGKKLAKALGYDFVDTDEYIVNKENMSIKDIFDQKGESYFRNLETTILGEIESNVSKTIISTGGGLPLREENRSGLRKIGKVYYLRADADTIYDRVKDSTDRPLLRCDNPYEKIKQMLEDRNPSYMLASDFIIDTDDNDLDRVVEDIKKLQKLQKLQ